MKSNVRSIKTGGSGRGPSAGAGAGSPPIMASNSFTAPCGFARTLRRRRVGLMAPIILARSIDLTEAALRTRIKKVAWNASSAS